MNFELLKSKRSNFVNHSLLQFVKILVVWLCLRRTGSHGLRPGIRSVLARLTQRRAAERLTVGGAVNFQGVTYTLGHGTTAGDGQCGSPLVRPGIDEFASVPPFHGRVNVVASASNDDFAVGGGSVKGKSGSCNGGGGVRYSKSLALIVVCSVRRGEA